MYDFAVAPSGYPEYYIAISPRSEWTCPHCKTRWMDWGEHAEDEDRPWEADDGITVSADPDLGWCCPNCAAQKASFSTLVAFIEDCGLIEEAIDEALTEDGVGAIEKGFHADLWQIYRIGFNPQFEEYIRDYVEQGYSEDFRRWVEVSA